MYKRRRFLTEKFGNSESKEQYWKKLEDNLSHQTEGGPIEPAILELIIALNALNIHTIGSCEGHLDKSPHTPWVSIAVPGTKENERQVQVLIKKFRQNRNNLLQDEVLSLRKQIDHFRQLYIPQNMHIRQKLLHYLTLFYKQQEMVYDRMLILCGGEDVVVLKNQGSVVLEFAPSKFHEYKLEEYREEMNLFATFLREKYFSPSFEM